MRARLNSIVVQFTLILVSLTGSVLLGSFFGRITLAEINNAQALLNLSAEQRAEIFRLAELARRLDTGNQADQDGIASQLVAGIAAFEARQQTFREGDAERDILPLDNPLILPILDQMDVEWGKYRELLTADVLAATTETVGVSQLEQTSDAAVGVFTYANRLERAINFNTDAIQARNNNIRLTVSGIIGAVVMLSVILFIRIVRALNALQQVTQRFAQGDYSVRAPTNTFTEFNEVGNVFNQLASKIGQLIANLQVEVTEAQTARARAETSDKVKSAFLASMSHELRTPLNAIINFSKFVGRGQMGPVNDQQSESLGKVVDSGNHLLHLINDVLDMSKIESGSLVLVIEDGIDPNKIIHSLMGSVASLVAEKPVTLTAEIPQPLPLIRTDRKRMTQILLNILSNACKFTTEGSILVRAEVKEVALLITVKDTGVGIAPEDYESIWESFKQSPVGLRQGDGTGLGLPISQRLAQALGGKIWFESTVGVGSTFFISLPLQSELLNVPLTVSHA
jgi:signal transduction histidine kinase